MCGHFLPLILLAALAVFFWPALGCENWPGKINLSCLFSFFLFNNGNYHQDYLAQRFLLVLVLVVLALTDKFISETCKIENVCRRNIWVALPTATLEIVHHHNPIVTCFLVLVLLVLSFMYLAISSLRPEMWRMSGLISFKLIRCSRGKMFVNDASRPSMKFKTFQDDNFPLKWTT